MPVENNAQAAAGRLDAFKNKGKDSEVSKNEYS